MRKLELMPYNEDWARSFSEESKRIKAVYGGELLNIYHIGSTSIVR
ncbi:GrpB family protein [Lederbergia sp. NSJ-179]